MSRWFCDLDDALTSGALQARLIWVVWLDLVVNVARPVDMVCCVHREVPKSPICISQSEQAAQDDTRLVADDD